MSHSMPAALKSAASGFVLSMALTSGAALAGALPNGGHFVNGEGHIGNAGRSVTVKQSSTTGIIDWNTFSIGSRNAVSFDNGTGATLNRVTGGNLSRIAGSLRATGSLYLINAQGVIVAGSGHIVTGGNFAVSSGEPIGDAFGNSDLKFKGANATVINRGSITAGGTATLAGSSVRNIGSIAAASVDVQAGPGGILGAGKIEATGNQSQRGSILLISTSGRTKVAGDLIARNADGSGGEIETSGRRVSIAGRIDAGNGGTWFVDPVNLTVDSTAAATIDTSLDAGTNVTLQTNKKSASGPGNQSSGAGDIVIDSALSWNTNAMLTLDAYRDVQLDADIGVTGMGGLTISTDNGANHGNYSLGLGDNITFANLASTLVINGSNYTLVDNIATLANDIESNSSGNYALAADYDATPDGTYKSSPISTEFGGNFEGLGNTITNLTIHARSKNLKAGLFKDVNTSGTLRDIVLTNATISGKSGAVLGVLVGQNYGTIIQASASGTVTGLSRSQVGGIVGFNGGTITQSSANVAVTGGFRTVAGGLVGADNGAIADSYATGAVTAGAAAEVGGLVGGINASITRSYATGNVKGGAGTTAGGLAGYSFVAIAQSYATGTVTSTGNYSSLVAVGGLVGGNSGSITQSYATGSVVLKNGHAGDAGGLVGYNDGDIAESYATGATTGDLNGSAGGLAGVDYDTITGSYSTGVVMGGPGALVGGFVGDDQSSSGIKNCYWDITTSGITHESQGAGNTANDSGIRARTTDQFQAALLKGFSKKVWAINPDINGGLPYLIALTASY